LSLTWWRLIPIGSEVWHRWYLSLWNKRWLSIFPSLWNQGSKGWYPWLSVRVFEGLIVCLHHHIVVVANVEVLGLSTA
jgi:hypothetical protein